DGVDHPLEPSRRERRKFLQANQIAVQPDRRGRPGGQMEVRGPPVQEHLEQLGYGNLDALVVLHHAHSATSPPSALPRSTSARAAPSPARPPSRCPSPARSRPSVPDRTMPAPPLAV